MRRTLMTAREVVKKSPVKDTFPTTYICDQIKLRERKTFKDCFTMELYTMLLDDMVDYPENPFSLSTTYAEDDVVLYEGINYISLEDNNTKSPTDTTWKLAPMFAEPCYNSIWCELSVFLAYRIIKPSLRYATYQAGGKGVVIHMTEETAEKTADSRSFEQYVRQIESDSKTMLDDVIDLMQESECASKFPIFEECGPEKQCNLGLKRIWMR
jgi:hypothetical protein